MRELRIYDCNYTEVSEETNHDGLFITVSNAAAHVFTYLDTDDQPYMIANVSGGVQAFVFQGRVYRAGVSNAAAGIRERALRDAVGAVCAWCKNGKAVRKRAKSYGEGNIVTYVHDESDPRYEPVLCPANGIHHLIEREKVQ